MADGPKILTSPRVIIPGLPSRDALKEILRWAVDAGSLIWSSGFDARCKLRGGTSGFNIVDVVNVIRQGRILRVPMFDVARRAWRIEIADSVEGFTFVLDVALDCEEDFFECPRVEVVTGYFRRGGSREVDEWSVST